jgi:hypothetical protein
LRILLLLAVSCELSAAAEELLTPGEQVLRELRLALSLGRSEEAVRLLAEVGGLVRYPASPKEALALVELSGKATARKHGQAVNLGALRALGEAERPEGAPFLVPFLQSVKPRPEDRELVFAALRSAGLVRSPRLVARLVELARKSPDLTLADQALMALSEYRSAPVDLRRRVTDKVLEICQSTSRRSLRWARLQAPGLRALQRLIGRRLNSVPMFQAWWKAVRDRKDPFSAAGAPR